MPDLSVSLHRAIQGSPFDPDDQPAWQRWRDEKLAAYPVSPDELVVEIRDGYGLRASERAALLDGVRRAGFAIYQLPAAQHADKAVVRALGRQLGLERLDGNLCADEDNITALRVTDAGRQRFYIPYTNRRLSWHTDGYYNPPERRIRGMILHCVRPAAEGGENLLLDHEMAWLHLRTMDAELVRALMHPEAMVVPPNVEDGVEIRGELRGPVFSQDADGSLHMRYTDRTRSIAWRDDAATRIARDALRELLHGNSPWILRHRLEAGQGVVSNNVLHARTAFTDGDGEGRLLYRARYYDRIAET